ncbi:MAG: SDR family NAD(P)-dependent oxidoreductase [Solirubrobacteraceae bacterium]
MLGSFLDATLDRTVVGGYSNLGYRLRRSWWREADLAPMTGKTVLVTGASSGLGLAAAEGFARLGAELWLLARDPQRGENARAKVAEQSGGEVHLELCDLGDLGSVRDFAQRFTAAAPGLDVLVNNAGVMTAQRAQSADGIELTFAVNVLAPFLLTALLLEPLRHAAPSRIINVSSGGMYTQRLRADDLQSERDEFDGTAAYARSKRAEVILTAMWARRLQDSGVAVHAMHPGWVDTPGVRNSLPRFYRLTRPLLRTPAQGADTIVWLGAAPQATVGTGDFWQDRARRPPYLWPGTRETQADRERLWRECEELTDSPRA